MIIMKRGSKHTHKHTHTTLVQEGVKVRVFFGGPHWCVYVVYR